MTRKKTTKETVAATQSIDTVSVPEKKSVQTAPYMPNVDPVVNTQVVMPKKRIRNRKKAVKKLSTAILCATIGFQRFI